MNLADSMNAQTRPKGAACCVVCGEPARSPQANPGWLLSLVAGAKEFGFTLKRPDGAKVHAKCRDLLGAMITAVEKKRREAGSLNGSGASSQTSPPPF